MRLHSLTRNEIKGQVLYAYKRKYDSRFGLHRTPEIVSELNGVMEANSNNVACRRERKFLPVSRFAQID